MKNVKYYAGFFDADGSFDFRPTKRENGSYYLNVKAALYQKDLAMLRDFAEQWEVPVAPSGNVYVVTLSGSKAAMFMEEVKKHLVIKRPVVELLLSLRGTTVDDLAPIRAAVQAARQQKSPEKNYPARQWMAGYVDGDGNISSSFRKTDGNIEFKLTVTSHKSQEAGLLLLHKAFGGHLHEQQDVRRWSTVLSVTKGQQVLGFFHKHLKVKGPQAALVLECLTSGKHLKKEGATMESNLQLHLRLQQLKLLATTN